VDRASVEVFANDGEIIMPSCFTPKDDERSLKMFAAGGRARIAALKVYKLKSTWKEANA
jgi:fructan beta-fructosidase